VDNDLIPKRPGNHSRNILTNKKLFDAADFIAELTQHIPPLRMKTGKAPPGVDKSMFE